MKRRRKIVIQGLSAMVISTVGIVGIGTTLSPKKARTIAFDYESHPVAAEKGPAGGELRRRRPTPEAETPPEAAAVPKNGDPDGLLENVLEKMIDNAIATFWSVINALIVAVTMRRYTKAGREAADG